MTRKCLVGRMSEHLPIDLLELSPWWPVAARVRPSAALVELVRTQGPVEPVVVRPVEGGRYEVLSNPETWLAAGQGGHHQVPVVIRSDLSDAQAAAIVAASAGEAGASPIAEARRYQAELERLGGRRRGAVSRVAARFGRSRTEVAHALRLLQLPEDVQRMVHDGRLTAGHARALASVPSVREQRTLARQVLAGSWSVRATERRAAELRRGRAGPSESTGATAPAAGKDPNLRHLEATVSALIGCPFDIDLEHGRASIQFYGDLEILEGVLERLGYRQE